MRITPAPLSQPAPHGVDVVIACWNRSDTIVKAITSALAEPEVVSVYVVDDASIDDTADLADALCARHPNLVVIRSVSNEGPAAARNHALAMCTAEWVTVLDGDDFLLPGRFAAMLPRCQEADLLADDLLQVPQSDPARARGTALLEVDDSGDPGVDLQRFLLANLPRRGQRQREMGFLKPLMRRSFLVEHGLRYDERLRLGEDFILYAHALALGARFRLMPFAGYVAVMREGSLSARHDVVDLKALLDSSRKLFASPGVGGRDASALRSHCLNLEQKIAWLELIAAVKRRDMGQAAAIFGSGAPVAWSLFGRLGEQALLRSLQALRQTGRRQAERAVRRTVTIQN